MSTRASFTATRLWYLQLIDQHGDRVELVLLSLAFHDGGLVYWITEAEAGSLANAFRQGAKDIEDTR